MKSDEDYEFERIDRENKLKSSGMECCTYDCNQDRNCPIRNKITEKIMSIKKPPHSKISYPSVPIKDFKWESGSDVQALWRKHGWTPPSEKMIPPPPEKFELRRVR